MNVGPRTALRRGQVLLSQKRPDLAERELRQALADDPNDALAHGLLSFCRRDLGDLTGATVEAQAAVHLAPDLGFAHYALSNVLYARDRLDDASRAIAEAIRLEPFRPDYFAREAAIRLGQRRWQAALEAAERGLQLDAEHVPCNNLRAMALVQMGRRDEAGATIASALARDPENAVTHANQGWTLLHQGDPTAASVHFREALRLDPNSEWARAGIVEALKARNPMYALLLRYSLWMSRLRPGARIGVVLFGFFGFRVLLLLERVHPLVAVFALPLIAAYLGFALLTWIGDPIFTLLLRFDRFGRYVLTDDQVVRSNWLAAALLAAVATLAVVTLRAGFSLGIVAAITVAILAIPVVSIYRLRRGWPRRTMTTIAALIALLVVLGIIQTLATPLASTNMGILLLGLMAGLLSSWAASLLSLARPRS